MLATTGRMKKILAFLILLVLTSCDCYVVVKGKILSSATGEPIEGAEISMIDQSLSVMSGTNGRFEIGKQTGFCFDPELATTKENYKPFVIELKSGTGASKYSVKNELEMVKLDKPFYPDSMNQNTFINSTWIDKYSRSFGIKGDSLIIYLDENNLDKELNKIIGKQN